MKSTQTVDLHDVDAYWKSRNLVDDRHRPYYLRWLQRFLTGPWGTGRLAPNDALAAFAQHLEQDNQTEEWQVRQAVRAVELFQKHYLRHLRATGAAVPAAFVGKPDSPGEPRTFPAALGETRTLIRLRHYAYRTEQTYLEWISRYGRYAEQHALPWMAVDTARSFLADLAIQRHVAASTQNQAFNALLFLLREVLGQEVKGLDAVRAKRGPRLPVVLSDAEVKLVLGGTTGTAGLMLRLILRGRTAGQRMHADAREGS